MRPFVALPYIQGTSEWVEARRRLGITASEAGAACGVGRFAGPFDVFAFHRGLRPDPIPTQAMIWGSLLEGPVADYGAKEVGIKVRRVRRLLQSKVYPWLLCSLDRWGSDGNLVEVKTTGEFAKDWGEAETEQVPTDPMCQVQTQMAVTGAPGAHVFVLLGGQHFKRFFVPRDDEQIEYIATITHDLWDRIQRNDPPPIDGSEGASAYLAERFRKANGLTVEAPSDIRDKGFEEMGLAAQIEALTEAREKVRNELRNWMGENSVAVGGDVKIAMIDYAAKTVAEYERKAYRKLLVTALET